MPEILGKSLSGRAMTMLAGILAAVAMAPATASADLTVYWSGNSGGVGNPAGRHGDATRTLLTSSGANSNSCGSCDIWAGAHYSGGLTLYASWATGAGIACHNYGTANIGAMFETPYTQQDVNAAAGWAGSGGSSYC